MATRTRIETAVTGAIEAANALQDRLVTEYFEPYSVTITYWAFASVFLYLGVQKVVPHRSTADVQLATIGGVLGIPYAEFVAFVGLYQLAIGAAFLLRRLRVAALLFFSYQFFAFGSLVALRYVVFQPPWLTVPVLGVEFPWALGAYSAFVLKNLIFAGIFFVLACVELDTTGGASPGGIRP